MRASLALLLAALLALLLLLLPAPAAADLGQVIRSMPCAGPNTGDLAWVDGILYQVNFAPSDQRFIYKVDPATGAVLGTLPPAGTSPQGLAYDGEHRWQSDVSGRMIYALDPETGAISTQFPAPGDNPQPLGLGWAAGFVWVSDNNVGGVALIYKMDPDTGAILASFPCPGSGGSPNGIAHDGGHRWIAVNTTDLIYQVDDGFGPVPVADTTWGAIKAQF